MKIVACALALVGVGLLVTLPAPSAHAQGATCQTAKFSDTVLQRLPDVRDFCHDVVTRDGESYAVIKAGLVRSNRDGMTVRIKKPDGTMSDKRYFRVKPDFRVLVKGKPTRVDHLALGQELTAYVKVTEPVIALEPASPSEALTPTALEEAPPTQVAEATPPPAMPRTASILPLLGLGGVVLVLLGTLLLAVSVLFRGMRPPTLSQRSNSLRWRSSASQ
jgi:hypothetical protein